MDPLTLDERKRQFFNVFARLKKADSSLSEIIDKATVSVIASTSIAQLKQLDKQISKAIDRKRNN